MTREQQLEAILRQIVNKALRPEKMPSTHHMVQKVPVGLIEQARTLLVPPTEADQKAADEVNAAIAVKPQAVPNLCLEIAAVPGGDLPVRDCVDTLGYIPSWRKLRRTL